MPQDSSNYLPRVVDRELDGLLGELPAVAIEGAKAVGKTATALRRAATAHRLDDSEQRRWRGPISGDLGRAVRPS